MIKCDQSPLIHKLRRKDADWRTTALCLHETLNVLWQPISGAKCWRSRRALLGHADRFIKVAQCEVEMNTALVMAAEYAITGYDAQYVALAQSLNVPLITEDRKLRKAVPGIAFSMQEFLAR